MTATPTFRCGHAKTPDNSTNYDGKLRCLTCKRRASRNYMRQQRGQTTCELERAWRAPSVISHPPSRPGASQ
jgi:hypothetical protein